MQLSARRPRNGGYLTVGIDGRGGAGKSTVGALVGALTGLHVIEGDDWFDPIDSDDVRVGDFNEERFRRELVDPIRAGDAPLDRPYDWAVGRIDDHGVHEVRLGVVVVRCYSFGCGIDWDFRIWVDTPRDLCLARGLARSPGFEHVVHKIWTEIWQPEEDRYIAAVRPLEVADLVLDGTQPFDSQLSSG